MVTIDAKPVNLDSYWLAREALGVTEEVYCWSKKWISWDHLFVCLIFYMVRNTWMIPKRCFLQSCSMNPNSPNSTWSKKAMPIQVPEANLFLYQYFTEKIKFLQTFMYRYVIELGSWNLSGFFLRSFKVLYHCYIPKHESRFALVQILIIVMEVLSFGKDCLK